MAAKKAVQQLLLAALMCSKKFNRALLPKRTWADEHNAHH